MSLKDSILNAKDVGNMLEVAVPEWDVTVYLKQLNADELTEWEAINFKYCLSDSKINLRDKRQKSVDLDISARRERVTLVAFCLCDKDGTRIFSNGEIGLLGKKSAEVVNKLFDLCKKHNHMTDETQEDLAGE